MPKVKVDRELLLRVAANARLNLTEEEIGKFLPQLQAIVDAFSTLDQIRTTDTKPVFQPVARENVSREDAPGACLTQEQALANAKHKENGYFKGPKVVT